MSCSGVAIVCVALSLFVISCGAPSPKETVVSIQEEAKPDMAAVKAEIQALESSWSEADNARDAEAIAAFYADDAKSMSNDKPTLVGKSAILEDIKASIAERTEGNTVVYETQEVFGDENTVTEIGTSTVKDASGKVISTGKYMAIWEKRNGKYICIRDIYNNDAKEK